MMNRLTLFGFLFVAGALAAAWPLEANVKLPGIFGDHMVLEGGIDLPVWGTADPGEKVTVTLGSESATATADADGRWKVKLAPLPQTTDATTLAVAGKNQLTFTDVLVGDVWLCSGQSNMEFTLSNAHNAATEVPLANDPQLRFFHVKRASTLDPQTDVVGQWQVCTPETAKGFSAVAYFFARDLRTSLHRPIGLIGSYWGGTWAQAWMSIEALQQSPPLQLYLDEANNMRASYPAALAAYPAKLAAFQAEKAKWDKEVAPAYNQTMAAWKIESDKAIAANQTPPPPPQPAVPMPRQPATPDGGPGRPTNLFNGMIAPLIPYGIKGVIWYQGESNANKPEEYATVFSRLITDWRAKWAEGNFPFLYVQLASYRPGGPNWNILREAQAKTLTLPQTGMASAIDIGDPNNIHPKDKLDVGKRLALVAQAVAYGKPGPRSGPIYKKMERAGDAIRITFTETDGGIWIKSAPWTAPGVAPLSLDLLAGFSIAGADHKWFPADATIDRNSVIVGSAQVTDPVAVRYAWEAAPRCNLYNAEGLPASPFRTDHWTDPAPAPATPPAKP